MTGGGPRPGVIQVLPVGAVAPADLAAMTTTIARLFGACGEILETTPVPRSAYRPSRAQYDADVVLELLFDRLTASVLRLVGVTGEDLFAEGRNFVFGYAHMRDRVAVFSTLRLHEAYWGRPENPAMYRSRVDKALAHELGHAFHSPHCERPQCVMHQVEFLWELDLLAPVYCRGCEERVKRVVARGVDHAEALFELGGSQMRRRRYVRAAAAYAAAIEKDPTNSSYHNDHGVALLAQGERAGATCAFERAMAYSPDSPHAYYNLGIVCRERGEVSRAEAYFAQALRCDEDPRAAHRYLGILYQDFFGDRDRAVGHFLHFVSLGGQDPEITRRLEALRRATLPDCRP